MSSNLHTQVKRLEKLVIETYKRSLFYHNKYSRLFKQTEYVVPFDELPYTNKSELLADELQNPPFGSNLSVEPEKVVRIHRTSGTTNRALLIAMTQTDVINTVRVGARCFLAAGLSSQDTVINCLNYNMWAGGYTDHQSLEATGAAVVPYGVGNTHNLVQMIKQINPTAIHCTPSYLGIIERVLADDFPGEEPGSLSLKLGLFGAEPGLQNRDFRQCIEDKWKLHAVNANYGLSEILSLFASESFGKEGLVFRGYDILYPELIDVNSKSPIAIEKGACGELVLTALYKEAQPLIKYCTGDIICITESPFNNDVPEFRFDVMGRTDDMFVVKGINVHVRAIENLISRVLKNTPFLIEIHIPQNDPIDKVHIIIESDSTNNYTAEHETNIKEKIKSALYIETEVKLCSKGTIVIDGNKHKKIKRSL